MIELGGSLACDNRPSKPLFQIFSGVARNGTACQRNSFVGIETNRLLLLRKFSRGNLGKLIECELRRTHVIPETLFLETFKVLVLPGGHTRPSAGKLVGQDGIFFALLNSAVFPLVGEFFASADGLKPLIDPFAGITPALVSGPLCRL